MKCTFSPFLVLDSGGNFRHRGNYDVRISGYQILNIDTYVPVIIKGKGCIGMAHIKTLLLSKDTTSVRFDFYNVNNDNEAKAFYDLYRNSINDDTDYEGSQDTIIPGMMGSKRRSASSIFNDDSGDDDDEYRGPRARFPFN